MKAFKWKYRWSMVVLMLLGLGALVFPLGCTVFGIRSGYEEAGWSKVETREGVEIRDYEALLVAQTEVEADYKEAGNQAFRRLFKYISGNNAAQDKIAMTTPVIASEQGEAEKIAMTTPVIADQSGDESWRYMFVLPAKYTLETAPAPKDPNVALAVLPARKVAVLRYAGTWKESTMREKTRELQAWIEAQGYKAVSAPRSAGYDPPWTIPGFRRNEVMIDIE